MLRRGRLNPTLKYILYGLGGLAILGIILYIFIFYKGTLVINPSPVTAKTTIANVSKSGATKFRLKPGVYNVKIEVEGYVSYEKELTIKSAQTITLNLALNKIPEPKNLAQGVQFLNRGLENSLLYLADSGKTLYKMDNISLESPEIKPITPAAFSNLTDIFWAPEKDLAVMKKTGETFLYDFKRYDLLHQEIHPWPEGVGQVTWSPDGNYVFYYFNPADGEKTLIRADRSNSNQERFYNLKESIISNPQLHWSADGKKILVITTDIYLLDVYSKQLSQLTENETVSQAIFSPDSQWILYSNNQGLFLMDLQGESKRDLQLKTTINKTVWYSDSKNLLAAEANKNNIDKLYKVNVQTGEKKEYSYSSGVATNLTNLILLSEQKTLYFNSNSNLYSLDLGASEY